MPIAASGPSRDSASTRASSGADCPIAGEHDVPFAGTAAALADRALAVASRQAPAVCSTEAPATEDLLVPASEGTDGSFPLGLVLDDRSPGGNVLVSSVVEGSWAADNGIRPGDEVVRLNGIACRGIVQEQVEKLGRQRPLRLRIARGAFPAPETDALTPTVLELEGRLRGAQKRTDVAEQRLAALAAQSNGQDAESLSASVRSYQERVAAAERRITDAERRAANALLALSATSGMGCGGSPMGQEVAVLSIRDGRSDERKPDLCFGCYPGRSE